MKKQLIEFYLDWTNNFLTIERMAEHYNMGEDEVNLLIGMGRKYHEQEVERYKMKKS